MTAPRTLIRDGVVITVDQELGNFTQADVLIEDNLITAVGPNLPVDHVQVIDGSRMIVLPGLIDTHRHTWQSVLRGIASDWTLGQYFERIRAGIPPAYRPEDVYAANLIGALEALNSGITTMLDWSHIMNSPEHADAAIQALEDAGLRAIFAHGTPSDPPSEWYFQSTRRHPEDVKRLRRSRFANNEGRVTLAMAIRGPDFSTMETTAADLRLARELGLRVTMHIGGGLRGGQLRSIERMHQAGLLGPDMTFVHCNCCADHELRMMADTGGTASVSARVEMQMGHGMPATGRLMRAGVRPSLSVDVATAVGGDLFDEMRTALQMERALQNQAAMSQGQQAAQLELKAKDVLAFATIDGARTCGLEDKIGSITPGKQADLILLRRDTLNLTPLNEPCGSVVLSAGPQNVDTIFVAGKMVKQHGRLLNCDIEHVLQLATASRDHLFNTAGVPVGSTPVNFKQTA
ncbi:MAG: amidohydrolase family protein [Anaerolineae bacterium]|nr:amidohydrolase family protein [Anaerolineae bacterium]